MNNRIIASSELMKNHKQADVMSPQKKFEALQTTEGDSLFFSIGTDNVFYLTRETTGDKTGWVKTDLSSILSKFNNGITIEARAFVVSQNLIDNTIDIVLAIKGQDQDYIYTALGLANTNDTWSKEIQWQVQGYDDARHPVSKVVVSDLFIAQAHNGEYIVADILADPGASNNFVHRYYLDPSKKVTGQVWNEHDLSADLNANTITSCLGKKSDQLVEGIYTLGAINGSQELIYTPLYNAFNPSLPANPSRLQVPQEASAIATAPANSEGNTSLFVAGAGNLYYFAFDKQEDGDAGIVVLQNNLFQNVTDLHAHADDQSVVVWGVNQQGQVFYTKCAVGSEASISAWSTPIPILSNVTEAATYLNNQYSNNVIFAHLDGTNLVKLTQDPVTTLWDRRNIVLPSTDIDDVLEVSTYTTHIQVEREDNIPVGGLSVSITSTSPVSVYINDQFEVLSPTNAVNVTTDDTGTITILQETDEIATVCYNLKLEGSDDIVNVNPMVKLMEKMSTVKSGADLGSVTVTNSDGSTQPLVPSGVSDNDKEATAQAIQQFVTASQSVPKDGTIQGRVKQKQVLSSYNASEFVAHEGSIWGMSFENNGISYHAGSDAMIKFGLKKVDATNKFALQAATVQLDDIGNAIESAAGDVFNWLKDSLGDVKNFFVKVIDGVYNFFITIGNALYTFVLNCYETIASAVEFVFNKIKVFLEDLIKWLGFLFQWKDILRTHDVLKNVFKRYLENSVDQVDVFKQQVNQIFDGIQQRIDSWAGLTAQQGTLSGMSAQAGSVPGKNDPQSNYGIYHMKNGAGDASTNTSIVNGVANELDQLLQTLMNAVETEGEIFENAYNNFKTQVIDQIDTLSVGEVLKRSFAILADILIESVENIVDTALDVIKILIQGVVDILDASLDIPVLSWLYKKITGNQLSFLDAVCLVLAIPTTLIYKISKNEAPFPDNSTTKNLINAGSWSELQEVLNPVNFKAQAHLQSLAASANVESASVSANEVTPVQEGFILIMRLTACISSFAFIALNVEKQEQPESKSISVLHGLCFYATTAPNLAAGLIKDDTQRWNKVVGEVVYGLTAIEKLVDIFTYRQNENPAMGVWAKATKGVDFVLGVAGLVPTFGALEFSQDAKTITGVVSDACWNANRIMTPFVSLKDTPRLYAVKMGLIGLYGVGQGVLYVLTLALPDSQTRAAAQKVSLA